MIEYCLVGFTVQITFVVSAAVKPNQLLGSIMK